MNRKESQLISCFKLNNMQAKFMKVGMTIGIAMILCPSIINAQTTWKQALLALSKTDHTLSIIDPGTLKVITKVPVGPDPHEVIASTDGKMAFVSNMGGGRFHELNVIDLEHGKALDNFDSGPMIGLHGLDFSGDRVWFTAEGAKSIGRYDPSTHKIDWIMGTGQDRTHMIYVTPDQKHIYTTNISSGTVSIIEYAQMMPPTGAQSRMEWTQTVIPVAKGSEGFDVSPDGKQIWTAGAEDGKLSVIDLQTKKVIATIEGNVQSANRLKFTLDGRFVLVSTLRSGVLVVFDVNTHKEIKRIELGNGAAGILMDPNGSRAFVACTGGNYIAVIDIKTWQIVNRIDAGGGPDGLAWAVKK